ncbi:hypothetical protein DMJ13_15105 [halophilic archaeon]|nr:hypothetical protein DMJ13_15105 [halophilic archaeon]
MMEQFFKGVGFRTNRPVFEPGEEIEVYVTGYEGDTAIARVGDSVLRISDAPPDVLDRRVRLRIEEFDDNDHDGQASLLDVVGDQTF